MTLIAILLALAIERLLSQAGVHRRPHLLLWWFSLLRAVLRRTPLWRAPLVVALCAVPPVAAVAWLERQIVSPFWAVASATLILLLCLGPRDIADEVRALIDARARGDIEGAARLSRALQRGPEPAATQRSLLGALFIQSHERLFGVLLWFFALGPTGAVLYRCLSRLPRLLHDHDDAPGLNAAFGDTMHALAAWIPARVTALLFGLAGSFDDALAVWLSLRNSRDHGWRSQTWAVLAETATGSLAVESARGGGPALPSSLDDALREVLNLQARALLILLAFFAFFATGGWIA
jgi:membrane protein required for beta-lactamase induction